MKKKSLVAMGLAGVMTVGMSCSVFADGEVEPSDPAIGTPQVDSKESTVEIINLLRILLVFRHHLRQIQTL